MRLSGHYLNLILNQSKQKTWSNNIWAFYVTSICQFDLKHVIEYLVNIKKRAFILKNRTKVSILPIIFMQISAPYGAVTVIGNCYKHDVKCFNNYSFNFT